MGDQKLIMADGGHDLMQRGFGLLNGIESEGWPELARCGVRPLVGRSRSFLVLAGQPVRSSHFNYIRHGQSSRGPWGRHRLAIAGAVFTGSGFSAFAGFPLPEAGEGVGVFDELRQGTEGKTGWLGRPKARQAARHASARLAPGRGLIDRPRIARTIPVRRCPHRTRRPPTEDRSQGSHGREFPSSG